MKFYTFFTATLIFCSSAAYASEKDSQFAPIALRAESFIKHFIDYETDLLKSDIIAPGAKEALQNNIQAGKSLLAQFSKVASGGKTATTLLDDLLLGRLGFLQKRRTVIEAVRTMIQRSTEGRYHGPAYIYGPTRPSYYVDLTPDLQFMARQSIDRYQFLNQLILYVWEAIDPRTLPAQTKLKIRCSTMLQDLLSGKIEDLGHPDAAILVYEDEPLSNHLNPDEWNYRHYLEEHEVEIEFLNWGKRKGKIYSTIFDVSKCDENAQCYGTIPELPYPEWLRPKAQILIQEPFQESTQFIDTPKLKDSNQSGCTSSQVTSPKEDNGITSAIETKEEPAGNVKLPIQVTSSAVANIDLTPSPDSEPTCEQNVAVPLNSIQPSIILEEKEKVPEIEENLRPRGMRLYHGKEPKHINITNTYMNVSNKYRKIIDEIFCYQSFQSISYGDFKSLWKHIHGPDSVKESTGSSHKKLIARTGQIFGTFAHGDAMTYTNQTIKYLRDALRETGYAPMS